MRLWSDVRSITTIAACAAAVTPVLVFAQGTPTESPQPLAELIVTGSRIERSVEDATGPVQVVGSLDIERSATDSIAKILQALPLQTGSTQNTNVNAGSDGSARVNLRGLGPERTLVLLGGRRFVFGGLGADTSVDLNMLPLAMIERVEISASGASAIYGADAVAGVVNVIPRQHLDGVEVGGGYHIADRGDGAVTTAYALAGHTAERGSFMLGAEYVDQEAVGQSERGYSAHVESLLTPRGPIINTGLITTPQGTFDVPPGNALGLPPIFPPFYFLIPGTSGTSAADYRPFDPLTDYFDYAPYVYLRTPSERTSAWLSADRKLGESLQVFTEALGQHRESQQLAFPPFYVNFAPGAAPIDPFFGIPVIPADNFYNPFGVPVFAVLRDLFEADRLRRDQDVDTLRALAGLRGDFRGWRWEGTLSWARNETSHRQAGEILRDQVRQAVGPSGLDASGRIVCGAPDPATGIVPASNVVAGCVPLNLFGGQGLDGQGTITRDQVDYISRPLEDRGLNEQWLADLIFTGTFGKWSSGPLEWALGAQYRHETGKRALDPARGSGVISGISFGLDEEASFEARELFAETRVPLLRDSAGALALDATFGVRYSSFSSFGDTTTFQGGLRWKLNPLFSLRGSYSEVFRAPSTGDLFAEQLSEITGVADPCGLDPSPAQRANCEAAGVPGGSYVQIPGFRTPTVFGGNPELVPESGETWTAGVLLDVRNFYHLQASLDYWQVTLDQAIDVVDPQTIANECANTGSSAACERITRFPDGAISQIDSRFANVSRYVTEGIDAALAMFTEAGGGTLAVQLDGTYLQTVEITRFASGTTFAVAGIFDPTTLISWPRWRAQAALDWTAGPWRVSYAAQYIDSFRECGDKNFFLYAFLTDDDCRTVDDRLYHDVSATYRFSRGLVVTGAIENVGDTDPPRLNRSQAANTDQSIYRLLGRTYSLGISYAF